MFSESESEATGFNSNYSTEKPVTETQSQTDVLEIVEQSTSTEVNRSVQCQTSPTKSKTPDVDLTKLAAWLKRIYPLVEEQLLTTDEQAFEDYNPASDVVEIPTKLLHLLEPKSEFFVSDLSWNCTGNSLAVGCGKKHEAICVHDNFVYIYTIDRNGVYKDPPTIQLQTPACITSIEYHPTEPSVLIAGCVSGQLLLWTPTDKKREMFLTEMQAHTDRISQISWHKTRETNEYFIVTAGLDASLITWNVDLHLNKITIKEKFKINLPNLINRPILKSERGIRCYSFSSFEPENFVVGVEGGYLLRCSLNGAKPDVIDGVGWFNPVISQYEGHESDVRSIHFSPHRNGLFLSCGSDGEVHIYSLDQESVVQMIFSKQILNGMYWIPVERKAIIGCGEDGELKIFRLQNGQLIASPVGVEKIGLTSISFNDKSPNMIAVGNQNGQIQIWNIPWRKVCENEIK